ncbi:MAG TPA: hypothetical protein VM121_10970 [Acidimicrobiales bacterium]|nr:hypothetical protein [Acidimicrobiales bacterium]
MNRLRPVAACAAAGVVIVVVVGMASPAGAAVPPTITVESPSANAVLIEEPTISGNVDMPGSLDSVRNVAVSLVSSPGSDTPAPCDPCGSGDGSSVSFSWSPQLSRNGPYQGRVTATGSQFLLGVFDGETTSEATVSFRMEVAPADPADVRVETNPDRTVRVTWARNSEPDMIAYRVQRKDPGSSTFRDVGGAVPQPASGSAVSIADPATAQGAGTFVYQVQAIRVGRSGNASTAVGSGFSSSEVLIAPPAGAPPPPGAAATPPAENAAPTPNLSSFLKGSGGGLPNAALPNTPQIPDGGFDQNLPFVIPPASAGGRSNDDALGIEAASSGNSARAVLIPVAGGLLLCLAAFHVRRFNGRLASVPNAGVGVGVGAGAGVGVKLDPVPDFSPATTSAHAPAATWLLSASPGAAKAAPAPPRVSTGVRVLADAPKKSPQSFDKWLKGSAPSADNEVDDASAEEDRGDHEPLDADLLDDDAKWAPLTAPSQPFLPKPTPSTGAEEPAWDDILVEPGSGTTRRS